MPERSVTPDIGHDEGQTLMQRAEDRDRSQRWTLCPRPICDKGRVYDTVNGIRQAPGYTCAVCRGIGFVYAR